MTETIGKRIRQARFDKGMFGSQVARRAGISKSFYCELEKERRQPGANVLARIAEALEVDAGYLLSGGPRSPVPRQDQERPRPIQIATSSDVTLVLLSNGKIFSSANHTTWIEVKGPWNQ